jgi:LysM repeat protein
MTHSNVTTARAGRLDADAIAARICPYLVAEDGTWRASRAVREHRCTAVRPSEAIPPEQQRQLCLEPAHHTSPAYLAAREQRSRELAAAGVNADRLAARRTVALSRPIPIALERPTAVPGSIALVGGIRRAAELGLLGLMLLAAVVLYLARFSGTGLTGAAVTAGPSTGASIAAVGSASPSTAATATPIPSPTPSPTPVPTLAMTPSPPPSATVPPVASRSYRVQRGDTLSGIAARFGTSVPTLLRLNDIENPRVIFAGQVLKIP